MKNDAVATAAEPEYYDTLSQTGQDTWDAVGSYGWTPRRTDDGFLAVNNENNLLEIGPFPFMGGLLAAVQQAVKAELESDVADSSTSDEAEKEATGEALDSDMCICTHPLTDHGGRIAGQCTECVCELFELDSDYAAEEDTQAGSPRSDTVELTQDAKGNVFLPGTGPIVDQQLADAAGKYHAVNTEWKDAGKARKDAKTELFAICKLKPEMFKDDPDNSNAKIYHAGGLTIRISQEQKEALEVEIDGDE